MSSSVAALAVAEKTQGWTSAFGLYPGRRPRGAASAFWLLPGLCRSPSFDQQGVCVKVANRPGVLPGRRVGGVFVPVALAIDGFGGRLGVVGRSTSKGAPPLDPAGQVHIPRASSAGRGPCRIRRSSCKQRPGRRRRCPPRCPDSSRACRGPCRPSAPDRSPLSHRSSALSECRAPSASSPRSPPPRRPPWMRRRKRPGSRGWPGSAWAIFGGRSGMVWRPCSSDSSALHRVRAAWWRVARPSVAVDGLAQQVLANT